MTWTCRTFGYRVDAKDPAFFSPFPDGRCFFMWQDGKRRWKKSPNSRSMMPKLSRIRSAVGGGLRRWSESLLLTTPPPFPTARYRRFDRTPENRGPAAQAGRPISWGLVKIFTQSAAELLDEWFESPEQVKVTLATDGVIGANGGPRSQGTAYILMHHVMGSVGGPPRTVGICARRHGRGFRSDRVGGAQPGAEIRTNAAVEKILVREGRARGVVLEGGDEIEGTMVASNLDRRDVPEAACRARTAARFRHLHPHASVPRERPARSISRFAGLPEFSAMPGAPAPHHRATMHNGPSNRLHRARLGRRQVRPPFPGRCSN